MLRRNKEKNIINLSHPFFYFSPKPLLPYLNYICSCFDRFPAQHEIKPQCDEGNAQYLPHVDGHGILEIHLTFFEELDEEAERKYQGDAEPEVEPFAYVVFSLPEYPDHDAEEHEISKGFVKLGRMAGLEVDLLEDKRPRKIGRHADDFGIHQVGKADEA